MHKWPHCQSLLPRHNTREPLPRANSFMCRPSSRLLSQCSSLFRPLELSPAGVEDNGRCAVADAVGAVVVAAVHHLQTLCVEQELPSLSLQWFLMAAASHSPPQVCNNKSAGTLISPTYIRSTTTGMCVSFAALILKTGTRPSRAHSKGGTTRIRSPARTHNNSLQRGTICALRVCTRRSCHLGGTPDGWGRSITV
jgi:hypothetical protein